MADIALSEWRRLGTFLLTGQGKKIKQHGLKRRIEQKAAELDRVLEIFAIGDSIQRTENLRTMLQLGAGFGILLFQQSIVWEVDWILSIDDQNSTPLPPYKSLRGQEPVSQPRDSNVLTKTMNSLPATPRPTKRKSMRPQSRVYDDHDSAKAPEQDQTIAASYQQLSTAQYQTQTYVNNTKRQSRIYDEGHEPRKSIDQFQHMVKTRKLVDKSKPPPTKNHASYNSGKPIDQDQQSIESTQQLTRRPSARRSANPTTGHPAFDPSVQDTGRDQNEVSSTICEMDEQGTHIDQSGHSQTTNGWNDTTTPRNEPQKPRNVYRGDGIQNQEQIMGTQNVDELTREGIAISTQTDHLDGQWLPPQGRIAVTATESTVVRVFPALLKTTDEYGQKIPRPIVVSEAELGWWKTG